MAKLRDAGQIIGTLQGGEVVAELGTKMQEVVSALIEHTHGRPKAKGKGKVVLTLDFLVESGTVHISAAIKTKTPEAERGSDFFWALEDGSLSTEHPKQLAMSLGPREVAQTN